MDCLRSRAVHVIDATHADGAAQIRRFMAAHPARWNKDSLEGCGPAGDT